MTATDVVPGTTIDDILLAVVAILVAITTLAALAHKPPVATMGRWIGWVFNRLIGEPVAHWYTRNFQEHAAPIVRAEVEPLREEVAGLRDELRAHVTDEAEADKEAARWRTVVDTALANIQQSQAPHLGKRASSPDPT